MRFLFLSLLLLPQLLTAQESRLSCPAGTSNFSINYGETYDCTMSTSTTHQWSFDATAGEFVGFLLARVAGTGSPCAEVTSSSGVSLFSRLCLNNLSLPGDRSTIQIPSTGKYKISITESGTSFQAFEYHLNLERFSPPTESAPMIEPNHYFRSSINPKADRDLYRIQLAAGDTYAIVLTRLAGSGVPAVSVVDNLGAARAYYNSLNQLVVNATASTSGTFGLWIYDQQGSAVFDYEVDFFCKGTCPRPTPVVKSVVNAAHPKAGLCSGAFAAAFGEPFATVERLWEGRDFIGNELPKTVEGVSAKFGEGKASVYYVSSNQVNLIMPDLQPGPSKFRLSTTAGDSALFDVTANEFCPAAFMFDDQRYAVALYSDGVLARTPSINGRSLRPGDVVSLYVTGLGPTSPAYRPGEIVPVPLAAANQVRVTLGGVPATVQYAGLIYAGLYQINVKIPAVAVGEQALSIEVGQAKSPTGVSLLVSAQ